MYSLDLWRPLSGVYDTTLTNVDLGLGNDERASNFYKLLKAIIPTLKEALIGHEIRRLYTGKHV